MGARERTKLIMIAGPTAAGKTALSVDLAEIFGGEVVSADSMQVYRFMDIGTAKPSPEERERVPHHLLDVVNPDEPFNADLYARMAGAAVEGISASGKIAFVVGGAGLYIRALTEGLCAGPPADEDLRSSYRAEANRFGDDYLYEKLKACDMKAAALIDHRDTLRIIRALEVKELTGRSLVEIRLDSPRGIDRYDCLKIGLHMTRAELYGRIERRALEMVSAGFLGEVEGLLSRGYGKDLKPMQSLGYKHMIAHCEGRSSLEEAIALMTRDTKRYAKRQLTWFNADKDISWYRPDESDAVAAKVKEFLRRPPKSAQRA
ncbi:MAG: tRNA (adenosine(37)-N6)-dimethylallyltransferase MiaA [Smithellaceae bacterium]|nr:tRNA (adenosine(37)-N6)-dimethylallyltransferase MiaA [Smithellaceae bacterium]